MLLARALLARPKYRQCAVVEHRRIFEAVTAGDVARARQAMSDHLDTLAGYLGDRRPPRGSRRPAGS
jgi:DNA-binding GntR family transcriptional regulator